VIKGGSEGGGEVGVEMVRGGGVSRGMSKRRGCEVVGEVGDTGEGGGKRGVGGRGGERCKGGGG